MRRYNVSTCILFASLLWGAGCADNGGPTENTNDEQSDVQDTDSTVLLLRDGKSSGAEVIARVNGDFSSVELSIVEGPALFATGRKQESARIGSDGSLALPPAELGEGVDSIVELSARGRALGRVRVRGIAGANWQRLLDFLAQHPEARLSQGERFAKVDELAAASNDRGTRLDLSGGPGTEALPSSDKAICARVAWGPGKVEWASSNPAGAGFSVKPESQWALIWAAAPSQDIDGIYRRSWGCNTALKVADSCTASVTTGGSITCCCNAAMEAFGHTCSWVAPASPSIGWPGCPL